MKHTEEKRCGVLAAGNWIVDHVKMIPAWPAQDTLITIESNAAANGGGAYNLLKDLSRMRCPFPLAGIGLIGMDSDGDMILQDCESLRIDSRSIRRISEAPTSNTDVMTVIGTGRRNFFHQHGANALLSPDHCFLTESSARIFYLGYLCLLKAMDVIGPDRRTPASHLLQEAKSLGMLTVADLVSNETSDFEGIINPSLPYLDYLFLNEYELARLAGKELSVDPFRLEEYATILMNRGVQKAVVVHLPQFALCVRPGTPTMLHPSVKLPQDWIAGSAGAGDAFAAGFVLGLHEGWDPARCLELGVCAAAVSLRDATCSAAILPWTECLELGGELGFNPVSS